MEENKFLTCRHGVCTPILRKQTALAVLSLGCVNADVLRKVKLKGVMPTSQNALEIVNPLVCEICPDWVKM